MSKPTEEKPPCLLCRCEAGEDRERWDYGYCRECLKRLDSFSSHQGAVIKILMERIEALEKAKEPT
jgi:hypothetical protein